MCPHCEGWWLDKGELDHLRAAALSKHHTVLASLVLGALGATQG